MGHRESGKITLPIDIVLLIQDLDFGGTQRYAINLLKHLNRDMFSPRLWVMRRGADMAPLAREAGVEPVWLSSMPWVGPGALAALAWKLRTQRPTILYTMMVVPNMWGRFFGRPARVPVMISSWRGMYPKQLESWLWPLSARIICNANVLKEIMRSRHGIPATRIEVIPNGVDADFFSPMPDQIADHPLVAYVGRLVEAKDPMTLVEGFRLASERMADARFCIVGNGPLRAKVQRFIDRHLLEGRIQLLPGMSDARPILRKARVFAMASIQEACPNAALEAMACGLPVVATRVGGLPEIIEHGVNGGLFNPGDPCGLADALCELLLDEDKRRTVAIGAREMVLARYSMEKMVSETERVLLRTIEEL